MGNIKTTYILGLFLTLSLGIIIILTLQTKGLKKELEQEREQHDVISQQTKLHEQLVGVDSLLVDGDYEKALYAYRQHRIQFGENSNAQIQLRIALAEKMGDMRNRLSVDSSQNVEQSIDTIQVQEVATPREIQQYDSISFALEKAKVQLSRMKRMVQQKSFGEYLTFKSSKGSQVHYVGQVRNGKAQGNGVAILSTGSRYEGEWKDNLRHGNGTFYWADGQYYEGEYIDDKRHGIGTYHWSNGEKFVGLWKDDQRTGEGTFYGKDGKIVASGIWEDDKLIAANKP
ncbi:MAG: MORN repeat-containing protein [Allomuricauda sp.]